MDAKEYFSKINAIDTRIQLLREQIATITDSIESARGPVLDRIGSGSGCYYTDRVADLLCKRSELQNQLCALMYERSHMRTTVFIITYRLKEKEENVIYNSVLKRVPLIDIANQMGCSERHVLRLKRQALQHFSELLSVS